MPIGENMVVAIVYDLLDNATRREIDRTPEGKSLCFMTGKDQILPGLEEEVRKLEKGRSELIFLPFTRAFGAYDESAVDVEPRGNFAGIQLEKGMILYSEEEDGTPVHAVVKDFDEGKVTVDYNHPLAGTDLLVDLTVMEVRIPTPEERLSGRPNPGGASGCMDPGESVFSRELPPER